MIAAYLVGDEARACEVAGVFGDISHSECDVVKGEFQSGHYCAGLLSAENGVQEHWKSLVR